MGWQQTCRGTTDLHVVKTYLWDWLKAPALDGGLHCTSCVGKRRTLCKLPPTDGLKQVCLQLLQQVLLCGTGCDELYLLNSGSI
jgi:hypothetical protein